MKSITLLAKDIHAGIPVIIMYMWSLCTCDQYTHMIIIQSEYKLSQYFAPVAVCTVQLQSFSYNFPHCTLRYLQLSTGCPHRFPGAASESFTHSVDRLFGNTWPPNTTLSMITDTSSVTKLFIPPSDRRLRSTTTSKLLSVRALNRHKFQDTPTTLGRWDSHFPPTLVYAFPARWH
jgi:hypothetical protein